MVTRHLALVVLAGSCALAPAALAETPFYQGKRPTVFVNFAAGGPTDIEARLFTRSIARHIEGNPPLIVRNMDGAGGMTGANYLGEVAPRDGSYIGYFSSVAWLYSILPGERRVPFDTYDFVAYQPGTSIHYMRTDVKPGIRNVDHLPTAQDLVVGGLSHDNAKDVMMRLTLEMLGVKYKYVTGYTGSQGVRLALQRGEVNFYSESPAIYRGIIEPMVKRGEVIPAYYDPGYNGQSFSFPKQIEGLDIPSFTEVYRKLKGSEPSGIHWSSYLAALSVNNAMQRIVVLPPNSPPAAIDALRRAVRNMQKDPVYIEDATKAFGYVPEYVADADTSDQVRKALRVDPEVTAFMRKFMTNHESALSNDIVLVTGASGFVGSAIAHTMRGAGYRVRVLVRASSPRTNIHPDDDVAMGDMRDRASLAKALQGARYLIHAAADYRLWAPSPGDIIDANVEGTRFVAEEALKAGVERIVYTSSVATIEPGDDEPADESRPLTERNAIGAYKKSKVIAERLVEDMVARQGLPAVIVNPSTPIGPRDVKPTPTGRIIVEAARGRMPGFVDTGLNLAHVDDVAMGHLFALRHGKIGERYILGGDNVPLGVMLADIAAIVGRRAPRLRLPIAPLYPIAWGAEMWARLTGREPFATRDGLRMARHRMFFSDAKARRELGYTSRPYREALVDAIEWFRDAGYLR